MDGASKADEGGTAENNRVFPPPPSPEALRASASPADGRGGIKK
jgi:hypothetical protein